MKRKGKKKQTQQNKTQVIFTKTKIIHDIQQHKLRTWENKKWWIIN
jgi:hypothetical protein